MAPPWPAFGGHIEPALTSYANRRGATTPNGGEPVFDPHANYDRRTDCFPLVEDSISGALRRGHGGSCASVLHPRWGLWSVGHWLPILQASCFSRGGKVTSLSKSAGEFGIVGFRCFTTGTALTAPGRARGRFWRKPLGNPAAVLARRPGRRRSASRWHLRSMARVWRAERAAFRNR